MIFTVEGNASLVLKSAKIREVLKLWKFSNFRGLRKLQRVQLYLEIDDDKGIRK